MSKPTLLVLAAGMGSRYGGLKQMDPIGPGGEALLDYAVFDAKRAGFERFVFVIRKDIEQDFRQIVSRRFERHIDAQYACQELDMLPPGHALPADRKKPWGTTHAVLCAARQLDGPFAAINADDYYGVDSYRLLAEFFAKPQPAGSVPEHAMVGFQLDKTVSEHGTVARGICAVNRQGLLESVDELTAIGKVDAAYANRAPDGSVRSLTGRETVSMNFWGFLPSIVEPFQRLFALFIAENIANPKAEFYLPVAVDRLIRAGEITVRVLPSASAWFGVTYQQDRPRVVESILNLVRQGVYPERLWP